MNVTKAGKSAGDLSDDAASALNKASSAVHSVIDDAAQKAKPALNRMTTMAHDAADKAASAGSQAADWLGERGEQLSATQKKLVDDASRYVAANPLKAVGIAVVAALLVGRLMR